MQIKKSGLALAGYYGMQNFGDDLFALIGVEAAKEFWNNQNISVTSPPILGVNANYLVKSEFGSRHFQNHTFFGKALRLSSSARAAFLNERYVYCGGSLFSEGPVGARRITDRLAGRKLSAIGVSIGPFATTKAEKSVRSSLQKMEFLALRDRRSYELAKSYLLPAKLALAADLAGLACRYLGELKKTDLCNLNPRPEKVRIGLSLCNYGPQAQVEQLKFCDAFVSAVRRIAVNRAVEIIIIDVNAHRVMGDASLSAAAVRSLESEKMNVTLISHGNSGVAQTFSSIASLDCYVSARLHGAIAAYVSGVPTIIHQHHVKLLDFANDVGLDSSMRYDISADLYQSISKALEGKSVYTKDVAQFAFEAERNFTCAPWSSTL